MYIYFSFSPLVLALFIQTPIFQCTDPPLCPAGSWSNDGYYRYYVWCPSCTAGTYSSFFGEPNHVTCIELI